MDRRQNLTINFDVQIMLEDRGDRWAAYIEPPGTTVYGATEAAALARVDETMEFFVHSLVQKVGVERFRRYLDSHGVKNMVVTDHGAGRVHRTHPISLHLETAAIV